uniref:Protein shuttle craft-like protein n=1 Tax=Heliconius erato TaxID=33431 RepID=L7X1P9_HELEA|nr:protein shuttle craft-like protein [Heliconius erato]
MSQWNNSYNYNNQYQPPNNWNGEYNNQYANQSYYPNRQYDHSNQYVSFDEFLSQMHISNVPQSNHANYNNIQYQNYPNTQFNNVPSYHNGATAQSSQSEYMYASSTANFPNNEESYQPSTQNQYNVNPVNTNENNYTNEVVFKSKLTPTATEFVPKNSQDKPDSPNKEIVQESNSSNTTLSESSSNYSKPSSSTNWRERPQSSQQGSTSSFVENNSFQKPRPQDLNSRNRESKYESKNRNQEYPNSHNDSVNYSSNSKNNKDSTNRPNESHRMRNRKSKNRSADNNHDGIYRNHDNVEHGNNHRYRNNDSNTYNQEATGYQDEPNHVQETNNFEGGQSKHSKAKNKESDVGRTFYNSSMPKESQDVRNGRESHGKGRKWAGSQRVRPVERSYVEDEQYANSYLQYREERNRDNVPNSPMKGRHKSSMVSASANTDMTQRERLSEQLDKGTLECLVCCERVKQIDPVWYCDNCYHVFHLSCTRKWAMSSMVESKWRCPACQNTNQAVPTEYRCMCGTVRNPEYQRGSSGAHTCGKSCKRPRNCPHPCTLLCHPGPCPPCQATVSKQCGCGAETRSVLCSSKLPQVCGRECRKKLECGVHSCTKDCHEGPCDPCGETVTQVCHCPAASARSVPCTSQTGGAPAWSCGAECARVLACGAHVCRSACHAPPCAPCPLRPDNVRSCPCGGTRIHKDQRKSCTDPIPLCGNICTKPLPCGPPGDKHFCKESCHDGACRVCPDTTLLQCRCGHSSREVPCADLPEMYNNKLSCGRHRCRTACCAAASHRCTVVCGRTLSCQLHRCEEFCHTGHCAPCPRVSFEELRCECGTEVILPPVRCGTKPPPCSAPCRRRRACDHPPHHACHSGDCPPCVVLTTKRCYGDHEERKTIPCSQEQFSCGLPCGKPLPCGKHTCIKKCHMGPCDAGKCTQPCTEKRPSCGHPCAAPCHTGSAHTAPTTCPSAAPCRRPVRATCPCARRAAERACCDNARDYAKMMSTLAASKMQEGGTVDLSDPQRPGNMLKTLECDEECLVEARSRRLALALQIRNPDVSAKLAPRYSEHVRATAVRDPAFAQLVHDRLTDLVQLAKKSKQKTRAHSFPSMNRQKRQFIHELCEHFGCESVAYDAEPNRNSWLPAMSVLEVLAREAGKRRVPGPVLRAPPSASAATNQAAAKQEPKIDYFDNPPEN